MRTVKLLIADDELHQRMYLEKVLDWESLGITLCPPASDGVEALEIARTYEPDLALLDINMPGMDGLRLVEQLQTENIEMVFGFVTGYAQFDYARSALLLGAAEFIVKPFTPEEMRGAVMRMLDKLEEKRQAQVLTDQEKVLLQNELLWRMVTGDGSAALSTDYEARLRAMGCAEFLSHPVLLLSIRPQSPTLTPAQDAAWKEAVAGAVTQGCEIFPLPPDAYRLLGKEESVLYLLLDLTGQDASLPSELVQEIARRQSARYPGVVKQEAVLPALLDLGQLSERPWISEEETEEPAREGSPHLASPKGREKPRSASVLARQEAARVHHVQIIGQVDAYLAAHYQDPSLSVQEIADQVYLDVSYLRRIFTRTAGCSPVEYLTEYRMREAGRLLRAPGQTVGRTAEMVGYLDPGYFSKCFKRYYGCTPSRYRESIG